jgi:hypothetical protein
VVDALKAEVRSRGPWSLFLPAICKLRGGRATRSKGFASESV